jgi:hypothetical protein
MTIPGPLAQADAFDEMGADLPLSQMYAGVAVAGVAAEGIEPAAKKKNNNKQAEGGGASALTGDDATLAGLSDTAEFLSQETTMLITTEEAVGDEVEEGLDRRIKPRAASSLPLVFGDKVLRSKVLLECEGDALDLSGDMGAVGRFSVCQGQAKDDEELLLDLKGVIYKTTIVPSNTFFLARGRAIQIGSTNQRYLWLAPIVSEWIICCEGNCQPMKELSGGVAGECGPNRSKGG